MLLLNVYWSVYVWSYPSVRLRILWDTVQSLSQISDVGFRLIGFYKNTRDIFTLLYMFNLYFYKLLIYNFINYDFILKNNTRIFKNGQDKSSVVAIKSICLCLYFQKNYKNMIIYKNILINYRMKYIKYLKIFIL